jgi:predicted membrane-bound mannosyltransferase
MEGALLDMRAVALIIILGGAVVVVYGRFSRNNPVAIVGYAVLAVGLILGFLTR